MQIQRLLRFSVSNAVIVLLFCVATLFVYINMGGAFTSIRLEKESALVSSNPPTHAVGGIFRITEEQLPLYYVFNLIHETEPRLKTTLIRDCAAQMPEEFCSFLFESRYRVQEMHQARIFLVPIFQSVLFTNKGLHGAVAQLSHHRYFVKFRGSDFVFLCYTSDCEATRRIVMDGLGRGVRAMWADRSSNAPWPCLNRRIDADVQGFSLGKMLDVTAECHLLQRVLQRAGELVNGRQRWSCGNKDTWKLHNPPVFDYGTVKDTSFKSVRDGVAYCGVPKVGSSVAVLLMRRMNDMPNWKKTNTVQIRNFHTGMNWTYKGKEDMLAIFNETQWVKGMLVRNPITRLLSGYRSKIIDLNEYGRVPGGWPRGQRPPTLSEFVDRIARAKLRGKMDWTDRHIRPQSALCGVRTLPYDFIGRYEERAEDMQGFLESLELWEKLGESGWGPDGDSALFAEDEQIVRKNKPKPVTHADSKDMIREYYTRDLLRKVIVLYDEDFTRFGFSKNLDDYL